MILPKYSLRLISFSVAVGILAFLVYQFLAPLGAFPWTTAQGEVPAGPKLVVAELKGEVTTFWMVSSPSFAEKRKLAEVHHREGYGVRAQVSPSGEKLAFTLLPPEGKEPDTDGTLWVMNRDGKGQRLLAKGVDMRAIPLWSWDGTKIMVKRSLAEGGTQILVVDMEESKEETLVTDKTSQGLHLIGWAKDGSEIYYAVLGQKGVEIASATMAKKTRVIGQASQGPARDFGLSPDSTVIAYSAQARVEGKDLHRILVLSTTGQEPQVLAERDSNYFGPVWQPRGQGITYGTHPQDPVGKGGLFNLTRTGQPSQANLPFKPSQEGFYVPLAWSPEGNYLAIRYLKGPPEQPTSESLLILGEKTAYEMPASGYVEFVGWVPSR